ncbi:MAG: hypothetical protein ABWY62_06215 [Acidimicrobiia bacterium]
MSAPAAMDGSRLRRWSLAALLVGLLAPAPSIDPGHTAAQAAGVCPGDDGVTVVVDATALNGELMVGCAPGSPQSGFDALVAAGFSVEAVTATPGLLCRIDGLPTPSDETCADDPPIDFYWAYWTVESGEWRYATEGAATREPEAGSVEGWSFVDGGTSPPPPGVDPTELGAVPAAEPFDPADPPPGFPWATVIGVGILAAFAVAGYRHARRRRGEIDGPP